MNKLQHLLLKLSEEANEVGQIASKCMQFGLLERHPDLTENNKQRLHAELNDLFAIVEMLNTDYDFGFKPDQRAIAAKVNKVFKYRDYSIDLGLVTNAVPYEQWCNLAVLAPKATKIKSSSYQNLFCRQDYSHEWINFEWSESNQRNWLNVGRNGIYIFMGLIDSFRFTDDEHLGTCTLIVNENTECFIIFGVPLDKKEELIEMMTHSPLLKLEHVIIEQVVKP